MNELIEKHRRARAAKVLVIMTLSGLLSSGVPAAALAQSAAPAPTGDEELRQRLRDIGLPVREADPARQTLLDERSRTLQTHQKLAMAASVPLALNLFISPGERESENGTTQQSGSPDLHAAMGMTGAALYFAAAYYAYGSPKVPGRTRSGTTRVHRWLSFVHFPAMLAAGALGGMAYSQRKRGQEVHGPAQMHSTFAVAGTTTLLASFAVMKFDLGSRVGEEKVR
ncbi:MAG: hypothetical protein HY079_14315 [Elusimicrobia bacterium]|nr:hypothetical protein [Elusimicrobiota bacterium]